ncbi:hypothetical protein F0U60_10825 [Archangium minus]|jgi:hypothetical protein|uniref:Uncharacterized protein n=1 Tax=Archangium minus TaxID=83450 RepID=A0ABY9WU33_9BACT|nr:hypothetical protein F0U62_28025 [Cystobacter fuscus]WNG44541.1 hypothetical protein F0U60_10825 [Archangium minus]
MTQLSQRARDYVAKMDKKNPGDVANALTQYSDDPNWMGDAMARLRLGSNRDTPLPGDITAQNRND